MTPNRASDRRPPGRSAPPAPRPGTARLTPYLFLLVPARRCSSSSPTSRWSNMFWYASRLGRARARPRSSSASTTTSRSFTRPELFGCSEVSLYYIGASFVQIALALYFATILSLQHPVPEPVQGHAVLPVPHQRRRDRHDLPVLLPARRHPGLGAARWSASASLTQQWLGDPDVVNYLARRRRRCGATSGLNFVLFLGAIQSIPAQLYEAAELDGANRWQQFRYIILPGIRPIIGLSFILAISGSLSVFEIPYIMTGGANGSETFVIQTVEHGVQVPQVRPRLGDGGRPAAASSCS